MTIGNKLIRSINIKNEFNGELPMYLNYYHYNNLPYNYVNSQSLSLYIPSTGLLRFKNF